jgi:4-amino-4-deoxy-L-arabinose transferase-like glycosyltransferase
MQPRAVTAILLRDSMNSDATTVPGQSASTSAPGMADGAIPPPDAAPAGPSTTAAAMVPRWLDRLSRPALAMPLLLATGMALFILNLGSAPLYTKGEPREAVTVFDIVHGGGIILPLRAGVEIPSKPLLMHWLAALISLAAGGVSAWTVRLPSATLAIAGMLATYLYVRRLFDGRAGLLAAIIAGTSFEYLQAGTGSRVDMTLTFFTTIAFFEFLMVAEGLRDATLPLYLAAALAVLTKGPIGAALPAMVAVLWLVLSRRFDVIPRLRFARGAALVAIIGGGWYLAAAIVGGSAFIHKQILNENLYRLIGHRGVNVGHAHSFYYEDLALLAGFMPWTPLALLAGLQALSRPRPLDSRLGYLIVWTLAVLIFYNLPQSKRGVYLLAIYPALAALVAIFLIDAIANPPELVRRGARMLAVATGGFFVIAAAASAFGVVLLFVAPAGLLWILGRFDILLAQLPANLRLEFVKWLPLGIAIPLFVAGLGWRLCRTRPTVAKVFFATALGFAAIAIAVNCVVEPAVADTLTLRGFAQHALAMAGANPIGYIGSLDYDFAFYSGRNVRFVTTLAAPYEYVVCSEDDFRLLGPRMRAEYERVAISNPTAFDGTSRMLLLRRVSGPESPPAAHPGAAPKSGV